MGVSMGEMQKRMVSVAIPSSHCHGQEKMNASFTEEEQNNFVTTVSCFQTASSCCSCKILFLVRSSVLEAQPRYTKSWVGALFWTL